MLRPRELQFRVGQQIAQRISILDRAGGIGEVAAGTLRAPRRRLRFVTDQQRRQVQRRDGYPVDHDLRHIDSPAGDDIPHPIRAIHHKIAPNRTHIIEGNASRQDNDIVSGYRQDDSSPAASLACPRKMLPIGRQLHRSLVRSALSIRYSELVAVHLACP